MLVGYGVSSAAKPLLGLAQTMSLAVAPFFVLGLRLTDKLGKGIRGAPRDALVADHAEGHQGRAFGYQRAMDHAGAVAGGLVAFVLVGLFEISIGWAAVFAVIPGIATLWVILAFVNEDRRTRPAGSETKAPAAHAPLSRAFWLYAVAATLFALANSSDAFLILRAREMGLSLAAIPMAWALLHVVKALTSLAGGTLSDRMSRRPLLLTGWVLYAAVYAGFAALSSEIAAWLLFPLYGVFYGATEGVAKAFVADLVPAGSRGRAFGLLGMLEGLVLIPTSVAIGWIWDQQGNGQAALLVESALAVAAALWLLLLVRRPTPMEQPLGPAGSRLIDGPPSRTGPC
jgi:MFS family permease